MPARGAKTGASSPMAAAGSASPPAGGTSKRRNRALTLLLIRSIGPRVSAAATSAGALWQKGKLQRVKVELRDGQLVALAFCPRGVACWKALHFVGSRLMAAARSLRGVHR